jgi:hypothetical protein
MRIPLTGLPFTAAMRVVDRIHHDTADMRTLSHPTDPPGFSDGNVFVI